MHRLSMNFGCPSDSSMNQTALSLFGTEAPWHLLGLRCCLHAWRRPDRGRRADAKAMIWRRGAGGSESANRSWPPRTLTGTVWFQTVSRAVIEQLRLRTRSLCTNTIARMDPFCHNTNLRKRNAAWSRSRYRPFTQNLTPRRRPLPLRPGI